MTEDLETLAVSLPELQRTLRDLGPKEAGAAYKEAIDQAYKQLALLYHPDRNQDPTAEEQMKLINSARDRLLSVKFVPPPSRPAPVVHIVFTQHPATWASFGGSSSTGSTTSTGWRTGWSGWSEVG